jgi:hypothetical protein
LKRYEGRWRRLSKACCGSDNGIGVCSSCGTGSVAQQLLHEPVGKLAKVDLAVGTHEQTKLYVDYMLLETFGVLSGT